MDFVEDPPFIRLLGDAPPFTAFRPIVLMDCGDGPIETAARGLVDYVSRLRGGEETLLALGFLVCREPPSAHAQAEAARLGRDVGAIIRVLPSTWLQEAMTSPDPREAFSDEVRRALPGDPYALAAPARSQGEFFGLTLEVYRLADAAKAPEPLLLHGMRTAGKTSLALQVSDQLARRGWPVVRPIGLGDAPTADGVARLLVGAVTDLTGTEPPAWMQDTSGVDFRVFSEVLKRQQEIAGRIRAEAPLFFVIDEADSLVEGARRASQFPRLYDLLREVRDLSARDVARFLFVGMSADLAQVDRFDPAQGGSGNPLFLKCHAMRVPSMAGDDARTMIEVLGARVAVDWSREALEQCVALCGGHPFLLRRLGSASLGALRSRSAHDGTVTLDNLKVALQSELTGGGACASYFNALRGRLGPAGDAILAALLDGPRDFADVRREVLKECRRDAWQESLRVGEALRVFVRPQDDALDLFADLFRRWLQKTL